MDDPTRVRVEVELDKELVELAATAGLDLNEVAGRALKRALGVKASSDERAHRWAEENAEAIKPRMRKFAETASGLSAIACSDAAARHAPATRRRRTTLGRAARRLA